MPPEDTPFSPGQVIKAHFPYSDPPKLKYLLAVCVTSRLFLVISSNPYGFAPGDSQIKAFREELECLTHDSWLDGMALHEIPEGAIKAALARGEVWTPQKSLIERIKSTVSRSSYLPKAQIDLIIKNLEL